MKKHITHLEKNEIFVFGSNFAGIHGAGAAKLAYEKFGALWGKGYGFEGHSFAIPTKDVNIQTLPIEEIQIYVNHFISFAKNNYHFNFLVTPIGCGLAGYNPSQIAPLFKNALNLKNVYLPEEFLEYIK